MTPNSGAGAGEDKAVSGDIVSLVVIILVTLMISSFVINEDLGYLKFQVNFTIMYRRENMRQYELRADTVHETNSWIDAIKMARWENVIRNSIEHFLSCERDVSSVSLLDFV